MEFVQKNNNRNLIIFIHGLNGRKETWIGTNEKFIDVLSSFSFIQENFDLALFTYGTKIFENSKGRKLNNIIKGFFFNRLKEDIQTFNVGIETIAKPLKSEIENIIDNYDSVTFIAHSMGGLVVKSAMTWMNENTCHKIKLFISLSVPHIGSSLANIGTLLLGDNPQIINLKVMGDFTTQLNGRFANLKYSPKIIYQGGHQDLVVPEPSAIPANVSGDFIEYTADDHFSILLIKNKEESSILTRIINELNIITQPVDSINSYIEQNTPFGFFITTIASILKIQVDLRCFTNEELNIKLRAGQINNPKIEVFFLKVREFSIETFPNYTVEKENNTQNYVFNKI